MEQGPKAAAAVVQPTPEERAAERVRQGEERLARMKVECRAEYAKHFERLFGEPMEGGSRRRPTTI